MMKYREIYEQYYTMVYRLCLLLLKNKQDAEDAAQTVFLKIMEKQPVFSDEDHTRAWLLTVTRNHCRDIQRSFWHKKRSDLEDLPEPLVEDFDKQEGLLFEIFQSLPKKQREVVYLYYFEDYSIKEISHILNRNESTIQSQLFAARKRMKKQFSATRAAAFVICLSVMLGFGGVAVNAASGGKVRAMGKKVTEAITQFLSTEEVQVADEALTLPIQIYASDLVGINEDYLMLANERGLLIYDRNTAEIAAVFDLQQIECNYLNANSIATRIFLENGKLYLFNEQINQNLQEGEKPPLPESAYIYDLYGLQTQKNNELNEELTNEKDALLTRTTDKSEIKQIYDLWCVHAENNIRDTFDTFHEHEFLIDNREKYDSTIYSRNSLIWTDKSGTNMLSCLIVNNGTDYELYTRYADGMIECEELNMIVGASPESSSDENADRSDQLPTFAYSGDDAILETICSYMIASDDVKYYCDANDHTRVYIPAPVIYDTVEEDGDLVVFCNLWRFVYYRNGNTLECEGGGEAPSRLRLHPNAAGGYEIVEDIRTGDGADYAKGIQEFCADYPGMEKLFFEEKENIDYKDIRSELINMYVKDNELDLTYYKDYGWDPVLIE